MKRSELVEKIAVYFLENQGGTTPRKLGEDIVALIEKVGMLPPEIKNPRYNLKEAQTYNAHPWLEYEEKRRVNEWESE